MRILFLAIIICLINQTTKAQSCENYINERVILDSSKFLKPDTILETVNQPKDQPAGIVCGIRSSSIILRPINPDFTVVSFIISCELDESNISVVKCDGNAVSGFARVTSGQAKHGGTVDFYCIKARHKSGVIYTLIPISIKIP